MVDLCGNINEMYEDFVGSLVLFALFFRLYTVLTQVQAGLTWILHVYLFLEKSKIRLFFCLGLFQNNTLSLDVKHFSIGVRS